MPENIVSLIDKIAAVKGQDYAKGLVDMANLLAPDAQQEEKNAEGFAAGKAHAENRPA